MAVVALAMTTFSRFSFHLGTVADARSARLELLSQSISNVMVVAGNGNFVSWKQKVKSDVARMWWFRHLQSTVSAFEYICCHQVAPTRPEPFLQRRFRLTTEKHAIYGVRVDAGGALVAPDLEHVATPAGPSAIVVHSPSPAIGLLLARGVDSEILASR